MNDYYVFLNLLTSSLDDMTLAENMQIFLPIFIINVLIAVISLVDLIKNWKVRKFPVLWLVVVLFVNLIGPILYLTVGKKQNISE